MYSHVTITGDVRYEMTEHVIPAAAEFIRSVGGNVTLADLDCMDAVRIEEPFYEDDFDGIYRLEYKAGEKRGSISGSFITFPASEIWGIMRSALDDLGMVKAGIVPYVYYLDSDEKLPEQERTKWTIEYTFEVGDNLCDAFRLAYDELIEAVRRCFGTYKLHEEVRDYISDYSDFYRAEPFTEIDSDVLDILDILGEEVCPYGHLYRTFHLGDRYYRTSEDHGYYTEKVFRKDGIDAVYTNVNVKNARYGGKVAIECETIAEEIGEEYSADFECSQSFSIAPAHGYSRSMLHNGKAVARLHYIRPDVYVLQPLELCIAKPLICQGGTAEKLKYLIVTRDRDGNCSFFAEIDEEAAESNLDRTVYQHRLVAWAGFSSADLPEAASDEAGGEKYEVSMLSELEGLLPMFAAIEDWVFVPAAQSNTKPGYSTSYGRIEDNSFDELNEEGRKLISIVTKWLGDDSETANDFFSGPGARVLSLLRQERPDLLKSFNKGTDSELLEDIYFVQRGKNNSYGVDNDKGLKKIIGRLNVLNLWHPSGNGQITMADILKRDSCTETEEMAER